MCWLYFFSDISRISWWTSTELSLSNNPDSLISSAIYLPTRLALFRTSSNTVSTDFFVVLLSIDLSFKVLDNGDPSDLLSTTWSYVCFVWLSWVFDFTSDLSLRELFQLLLSSFSCVFSSIACRWGYKIYFRISFWSWARSSASRCSLFLSYLLNY